MIVKSRTTPVYIQKLDALLRRLPKNHPKLPEVHEDYLKRMAGYRGEQALDHPLKLLPEKEFFIFHDLRLANSESYFQIDTLLLSTNFALILEVKNISGTLFFDQTFHQLIRIIDEKEEGFPDPLTQVKSHKYQLTKWLHLHQFHHLPIDYLVIISKPSTILKTNPEEKHIFQKISFAPRLWEKIEQLKTAYQESILSDQDLKKLKKLLLKKHTEPSFNILQTYQIPKTDIMTGVHCPNCYHLPMNFKHGTWFCAKCGKYTKDAYIHSIKDYFMLIDEKMTNPECREFLHLDSNRATKLLAALNLPYTGEKRWRVYHKPDWIP